MCVEMTVDQGEIMTHFLNFVLVCIYTNNHLGIIFGVSKIPYFDVGSTSLRFAILFLLGGWTCVAVLTVLLK